MNHAKGMYWINPDKSLAFFGIPKNSSTSIRRAMGSSLNVEFYYDKNKSITEDTVKFSVIREPLDRCLSSYLEVIKRATQDAPATLLKKFYNMPEGKDRFIEFLNEIDKDFYEVHTTPQSYLLTDPEGNLMDLDYLFIAEDLQTGINKLKADKGIELKIQRINASKGDQKEMVKNYLDDTLIERIKQIYSDDFELYEKIKNEG